MDTNVGQVVQYGNDSYTRTSAVGNLLNLIAQYGGDSALAQTLITLDKSLQTLMIASITKFANEAVAALVVTPASMPTSLQTVVTP